MSASVLAALKDVSAVEGEDIPEKDKEERTEEILVPAFQGQRPAPQTLSRFVHIPTGALLGMLAGSILAAILSVLFF